MKMPLHQNILRADDGGVEAGRLRVLDCGVAGQPASWNIIDTHTWGRCGAWVATCFRAELSFSNGRLDIDMVVSNIRLPFAVMSFEYDSMYVTDPLLARAAYFPRGSGLLAMVDL